MPKPIKIVVGTRYGRLMILREVERVRSGKSLIRRVLCRCDCGNEVITLLCCLRANSTRSCGCLKKEKDAERNFRHGYSQRGRENKTYRTWRDMIYRCSNLNSNAYNRYGGRGVAVCERWQGEHGFENFLADMGECPEGMTLERENNNGNYEPSNCKWATRREQNRNRRNNVRLEYCGRTMIIADWARELGIKPTTLYRRLQNGWSIERALAE